MQILEAANKCFAVRHPSLSNNNHINIASIIGDPRNPKANYMNVHVFSNRQYDRSPGGTATCARMAVLHTKGQLKVNADIYAESLTGGLFKGRILDETMVGNRKAIIPEITGTAFITGFHQFIINPEDLLGNGFLF
jgi:proline racemase